MLITWLFDMSENVFDHSGIYEVERTSQGYDIADDSSHLLDEDDFYFDPLSEGVFELTEEGEELYDQWCDDASVGYDLCYGRAKGLAQRFSKRELWEELTTTPELSTRISIN